jgi:hypothetical protein
MYEPVLKGIFDSTMNLDLINLWTTEPQKKSTLVRGIGEERREIKRGAIFLILALRVNASGSQEALANRAFAYFT